MTTFDEALAGREEKYAGWTDADLRADARADVLRLLNVFTDVESPTAEDIEAVRHLADAACQLSDPEPYVPGWMATYPEAAHAWRSMRCALFAFMTAKAFGKSAADLVPRVFAAHRALAKAVQEIATTDEEMQAIMNAVKK